LVITTRPETFSATFEVVVTLLPLEIAGRAIRDNTMIAVAAADQASAVQGTPRIMGKAGVGANRIPVFGQRDRICATTPPLWRLGVYVEGLECEVST
jgi:hypothetical protein